MEEDSGGKLEAGGEGREICFYGRRIGGDVTSEEGKISLEEGKEFLSNYRSGLYGYTYLE